MTIAAQAKPLLCKTVLATGSPKVMKELVKGLSLLGAEVIPFSTIEIREIEDKSLIDQTIRSLSSFDWIIFTSAYGARYFLQRATKLGILTNAHDMPKICAVGPATAAEAQAFGCCIELVPDKFVAEGILESLAKYAGGLAQLSGKKILIPRAKEGREILPKTLVDAGASVDVAICYETVQAKPQESVIDRLRKNSPDLIIFTSPSTVKNLFEILGSSEARKMLLAAAVAVLGPVTGHAVESFGKTAEIFPDESTIPALLAAVEIHYAKAEPGCEM